MTFALGSLVCGFADHFWVLIMGRLIQGVGFSISLNLAILVAQFAFPKARQGFATGCCGTMTGVALSSGPIVGTLILHLLESVRKWVFFLLCIQTDADFWDVQGHNTDLSRDMQHTSHGKGIPE